MDSQLLCYICRKPGHFKANCPHPIVSKHQDNNTATSPSKETGERYKRSDKSESSKSRNERRRMAMVVNETSDTVATESSSSSSSSEDENTDEEKGLLCLFSQELDELCLMADEDENDMLVIAKEQLEKNVLALKEQCTARETREQELLENPSGYKTSINSSQSPQQPVDEDISDEEDILSTYTKYQLKISEPEPASQEMVGTQQNDPTNMSTGSERTITEAQEGKSEILNDPLVTEQEFNQFLEHSQHIQSLLRDTTENESRESFHSVGNPIGYVKEDSVLEQSGSFNSSPSSTPPKMTSPLKSTASSKKKKA
ncbi:PREDICTED: uncharacterized protein LOC109160508 [Ipomoea nil]|uniref:uncharacterized protein LOC109160508 n=1 Tax=Ipomoea nil TaxID=35883 RepID=UPI000900AFE0|nr:PREDICTED: uncharacterized protein LOC109160508 [Ipomoea nil]